MKIKINKIKKSTQKINSEVLDKFFLNIVHNVFYKISYK